MEIRYSRNIYSRDRIYCQKPWLGFSSPSVEGRFQLCNSTLRQQPSEWVSQRACYLGAMLLTKVQDWPRFIGYLTVFSAVLSQLRRPFKLIVALVTALLPMSLFTVDTTGDTLIALMPAYVLFGVIWRDWLTCLGTLGFASFGIWLTHSAPFTSVVGISAFLALLSAIHERDFRAVWTLFDSYKRSCLVYFDIINRSADATFITDLNTRVLYANIKGQKLLRKLGSDLNASPKLSTLTEQCGANSLGRYSEICREGSSVEAEISFCKKAHGQYNNVGPYTMRVEPISWKLGNCLKFNFTHISSIRQQRHLIETHTKSVLTTMQSQMHRLESLYSNDDLLELSDLHNAQEIYSTMFNMLNVQMLVSGSVKLQQKDFNFQHELVEKIEAFSHVAYKRSIDISLTCSTAIPRILVGDPEKTSQLVKSIVGLAANLAKIESMVQVNCDLEPNINDTSAPSSIELRISVSFMPYREVTQELDALLNLQEASSIKHTMQKVDEYGLGVAFLHPMLKALHGHFLQCGMDDSRSSNASITFL